MGSSVFTKWLRSTSVWLILWLKKKWKTVFDHTKSYFIDLTSSWWNTRGFYILTRPQSRIYSVAQNHISNWLFWATGGNSHIKDLFSCIDRDTLSYFKFTFVYYR